MPLDETQSNEVEWPAHVDPSLILAASTSHALTESHAELASVAGELEGELQIPNIPAISTGYADIYHGVWKSPEGGEVEVAIKELRLLVPRSRHNDPEALKLRTDTRMKREALVWSQAKHPNLHPLLGYRSSPRPQLISPWSRYGNLNDLLRENPNLSRLDKLRMIHQAACGLEHLHSQSPPICHADIKPENALINDYFEVVLSDFGLSRVLRDLDSHSGLTTSEGPKGTHNYMARELFLEEKPRSSCESDVYAFGCLILTAMSGKPPYIGLPAGRVLCRVMQNQPPKPEEHPGLSSDDPLWSLLGRCWDPEPALRPQMTEIVQELREEICHECLATSPSGSQPNSPETPPEISGLVLAQSHGPENEPRTLSDFNSIEDCYRFVGDIRRTALEKGLYENKQWVAWYAASRLEGQALLWHALDLDGSTRCNWNKLQLAILERARGADAIVPLAFRRRLDSNRSVSTISSARNAWSESGSPSSPLFLPDPDAPVIGSPASDTSHVGILSASFKRSQRTGSTSSHSSVPRSPDSVLQQGKLILKDSTGGLNYIGVSVSLYGLFKRTSKEQEALYLDVDRDLKKMYLQTPRSWRRTLGITWDIDQNRTADLEKGSKDRAYLVYIDHNGKSSGQGWGLAGPSKDSIWSLHADKSVHPIWIDENGVKHKLEVVVKTQSFRNWHQDAISLVADAEAFMKDHSNYMRSSLVFDP